MKKWVCSVCGYVHEGDAAPSSCPQCKVPADKFKEQGAGNAFAAEHVLGVAKGVDADIVKDLQAHFSGECCEVGMYLAMARVAHREGYPEIGAYWEKAAYEEAEHAAKFAELLGEVVTGSTKKNLELRVEAEFGACAGKTDIAKRAKRRVWMRSTTPFMKWLAMKPVTVPLSKGCSRDISGRPRAGLITEYGGFTEYTLFRRGGFGRGGFEPAPTERNAHDVVTPRLGENFTGKIGSNTFIV